MTGNMKGIVIESESHVCSPPNGRLWRRERVELTRESEQGKMLGRGTVAALRHHKSLLIFGVFISLLHSAVNASPARSPGTCGPASCEASGGGNRDFKFHYKEGGVYTYAYSVNGTIFVEGGLSEQSGLHFTTNATIHFVTACDAILHMKDVELWQSVLPSGQDDNHKHHFTKAHTSQTFKESLEQFPLRFSYADGLIEEICPHPKESAWILNAKRGFLSAFQNTMRRLDLEDNSHEDDVNGHCGVKYRLGEATSSTLTVEKVKDLNSCGAKYGVFSSIQGTPYNFGPLQQSMPAVESLSECNQVVDRNLIVEVQCMEKHRLKPLSNGASGVYASISQYLDLITVYVPKIETDENGLVDKDNEDDDGFGLDTEDEEEEDGNSGEKEVEADTVENAGSFFILSKADDYIDKIISTSPEQISKRESLHFRHEYHPGSTTNDYTGAAAALVKFCQAVKTNVEGNAGSFFETLVSTLKGLNRTDMMHLYREAPSICGGDRSPFDNVLEAVGSAASVGVIKDRISSGDAPRETISSWINSLTFIPKPDLVLMEAALPILRFRDNYPNILLSYSSLAHSFCRQNPECLKYPPMQSLGRLYERFFNHSGCVTKQRKNVDQALMYLKGIGNFGVYSEGIHGALRTCISSNDKSEIRVAAIEAYRRMSCSDAVEGHADLRKIFEDQHEDAEIRLTAFLTLMRCATYSTIRWLKGVMEKEEIRQVTSFVSSYVKNLQESSLPSKLELQGLVSDEHFNDPYHTDFRQFSKNFEVSAIYPDGNFGIGVDSNLIFSQDSYIPRSTSFNLTVDLFGESINVMEGAVRLEHFEHYVESIFGPNGKLSSTSIHKLLSTLRRERRAVPSKRKMRTLALEYDARRRYYSDPIVSLSLKTLGNEISFSRMVGLDEQLNSLDKLNPLRLLEKLSNTEDSNWQKSTMLFDSSYIIPTGVGLPLNLSAQASSIMRFQAESMIDATNFRANPFQLKLKGKLAPSATVTASATVFLSAFQSHAGMKVRAQLASSTALEGGLELNGAELLDVEFGVPKAKQELIEFKSEVLFLNDREYKAAGKKSPELKTDCNTGLLYKYMGLKMCTSSYFVPPPSYSQDDEDEPEDSPTFRSFSPFLINGPSYLSLTLDKSNPSLVKTRFHYQWKNNESHTDFKLRTIKTTGLAVSNQRENELGIQYSLAKQDNLLSLNVNLPNSRIKANGLFKGDTSNFQINVTEKGSGREYMGSSLSFDRVAGTGNSHEEDGSSNKISGTYTGSGDVFYKTWRMDVGLQASVNSTRLAFECKGSYNVAGGKAEKILLQLSTTNQEQRRHGQLLGTTTNRELAVDFTQYPDYNTMFLWKSLISEEGYQNDIDFRQGRNYLTESDPTTFRIQGRAHHESNHERTGVKWMFLATQPSQQTDWGVEAGFNSHGKSFDSAISFRYAPGQSYGTSISVERKPGVMLFLNLHWNLTIPHRPPMEVLFRLDEHSPRVYQAQHKVNWFGANHLGLDIELSDRSRRNKADTTATLTISTKTIDNLKLGFHYLSEERETKLQLSSEYENQRNGFEAGHIVNGARKHKLYGSVTVAEVVYLIMTELDFEHGVQCSVITDLGPEFSDIQVRAKATNQNGLRQLNFDYSWDVSRDSSKQFLLETLFDSSRPYLHRFEGIVVYPGYNYFGELHHRFDSDDRSRVVMGRLKWKDEEHLHVNAQLVPRISDHEAYDVLLEVATPFELVKNVSFNTGIEFFNARTQCLINVNGTWGNNEILQATVESLLESLEDAEGGSGESGEPTNDIRIPFKYTLKSNVSSSIEGFTSLRLNLQHSQFSRINCKTDLDIQLANEKEISMTNHLVLPESFSDLLSTRIESHIKTPFVGLQNMDVQAILGRQEDKDVLGMIGIYVENFQYSLVITGTPRFEEDGALGFEMTTSNPKYDKIFGSFSYVIGDNSRLACQLGWAQVVVGLEAGFESSGWEEFQVYLTFTSPWMPVKNINTLAKIDMAQFAEIKLELNEDGVNAKCEWVIESWTNFDVRLGGSTPFAGGRTFGGVVKNSWDDPVTYHSQIRGWVEDHQVGYKLEGGTSEKEEECGFAIVRNAQLELDTVVYPTVRATFNLANLDIKYNLDMSILLREGPINVIAELEVLDVFRFNEKILITTPYPALFELEINLNPAIVLDRELFNLGLHSKWRSGSKWDEGGLVLRYGPQDVYAGIVAEDLENMAFLECGPSEREETDGEGINDYNSGGGAIDGASTVDIPRSQLFHFFSPLNWASVVKLEYQQVSESPDSDNDGGSQALDQTSPDDADQFPLRNFAAVYQGYNISFSTVLQNEALTRTFTVSIDTPTLKDRLTAELDCSLDFTEAERKLNFRAVSRHPVQQEYSLTSLWNNQLPQYFSGNVEVHTPFEKLEQQSSSLMYAHNEGERTYTVDLEFLSITFDKLATNVVLRPRHFSMTLNTPLEDYKEVEIRGDTKDNEESPNDGRETFIFIKNGESEIELDLTSQMEDEWPAKIQGTIAATFGPPPYRQGTLEASSSNKGKFKSNATGEISWKNNRKVVADLYVDFPVSQGHLQELKLKINTTFEGLEHWRVDIVKSGGADGIEYVLTGMTPYNSFATVAGDLLLKHEGNWLDVTTLNIHGNAPNLNVTVEASWHIEKWNDFEMNAKSKYRAIIEDSARSSYNFLKSIPDSNSFAISLANKIPTFSELTSIDSKALIKLQEPALKAGQHVHIVYLADEAPTFTLRSSTVSMEDSADLSMKASFDKLFNNFDATANYKSSGSSDRIYGVDCKWEKHEKSVDAAAELIWGSEALGAVSVHGIFNCSVSENSTGMLHARIGAPVQKLNDSNPQHQPLSEEQTETPNVDANPLDNPLITIDGTFNKISGQHSARLQFGQDGLGEPPILAQVSVHLAEKNDFDAVVNFTSSIENYTDVGFRLRHKLIRNSISGTYGGHWDGDEAMLRHSIQYENTASVFLVDVSLFGVIPISTESVPRPQRVGIDVFYKGEGLRKETVCRGEYNGVQLLKANYKSGSVSSAGIENKNTQLELDNHFWPYGLNYTYQLEYSGGTEGLNLPTKAAHFIDLYNLHHPNEQKLEGELNVGTNFTGERIAFQCTHPTRKVHFITDYNCDDNMFQHATDFSWKEGSRMGYQLALMNMSNETGTDHRLSLQVNYPIRSIHLDSGYTFSGDELQWTTSVNLNGSRTEDKIISTVVCSLPPQQNKDIITGKAALTIQHPALVHDMIAAGELTMVGLTASSSSPGRGRIDGIFSLEYSDDPTQRLILNWDAKLDFHEIVYGNSFSGITSLSPSSLPYWEVETNGKLEHLATNLDLKTLYSTQHSQHGLSIIIQMDFKNSVKDGNKESKMAFELLKDSKEASLQLIDPEGYALFWSQLTGHYPEFVVNGKSNVTGIFPGPEANISLDLGKPYFTMYAVHGKDLQNGVFGEGGVVDSRNAVFDISESYNDYRYSDVNFYLRLNHSRLITSKLQWRPELFSEIYALCIDLYKNSTIAVGAKWDRMCAAVKEDASQSASDLWTKVKPNVAIFMDGIKEDINFKKDVEAFQTVINEMYGNNEFNLQDLHDYVQLVAEEVSVRLKKTFQRHRRDLENPVKLLEKAFSFVVEQFQKAYEQLATYWKNLLAGGGQGFGVTIDKIKQMLYRFINDGIEVAEQLIGKIYQNVSNFLAKIYSHLSVIIERYRPSVMAYVHQLEAAIYNIVNKILDFFYETKDAVVRSPYYQRLVKLTEDLDEIYKDFKGNDLETNLKKYYSMLRRFVMRKLQDFSEMNFSMGKIGQKIKALWEGILETELVQDLRSALETTLEQIKFTIQFTEMDVMLPKAILTLISKGKSILFMTAIDAASRFEEAKTKFYFHPGKGIVSLEQKLPMPLAAFNETPEFKKLPEYRAVLQAQDFFQSSDHTYKRTYNQIVKNPFNVIPPFEGHAMVAGPSYFFTFDGLIYSRRDPCVHLLTADLVDGNFSVSLQYENDSDERDGNSSNIYNIIVASGHNTLIVDLVANEIKDPKRSSTQGVSLPIQMANLQAYQEGETLIVHCPKGLTVSCNTVYQICQIKVSGWYSRKISGTLGTMDMEPFTDLATARGKETKDIGAVFRSWDVSDLNSSSCSESPSPDTNSRIFYANSESSQLTGSNTWCHRVFQSQQSSLQPCFSTVNGKAFLAMCLAAMNASINTRSGPSIDECKSAVAYAFQCDAKGVAIKVPTGCIKCEMDGETMTDRDLKVISSPPSGSPSFSSTDIVLIVEAKDCNRALRTKRKTDTMVASLEEEFERKGFKDNRYAAVVYGGDGVFNKPHSIVQNLETFTSPSNIGNFVSSISLGNGNNDTFNAIWYSLHKLDFRPGVSKTLILFPCSTCNPKEMKKDFSTLQYAMLEQDAKLHILMNRGFLFDSKNLAKKFFGYDANLGFTKSDGMKARLKGDPKIRHQVFLPKRMLGHCAPLALETNGTIFSATKLQNRREKVVKSFATVFSRRVVMTAVSSTCQTCYCLPKDRIGIGKVECFVCDYPRYKPPPDDYEDNVLQPDNLNTTTDEDDGTEMYDDEDEE